MGMFDTRSNILTVSLFAILSAFVVEMIFGLLSNSLALIMDSLHALMDAVVSVVLIIAARMAMRPADKGHGYGYGKLEPLGGMFGGIAIFVLALLFITESIHRLTGPPPEVLPSMIGLVGGIYTIIIDFFRIYILRRGLKGLGGHTLAADLQHALMDMGSTVLAIVGIALAAFGLYYVDFGAALILGALLIFAAIKIVYRASLDLIDVTPPKLVDDVKRAASTVAGVIEVGAVLLRRSGDTLFAEVTVVVKGDTSLEKAHYITEHVEAIVKKTVVTHPIEAGHGGHSHEGHEHEHEHEGHEHEHEHEGHEHEHEHEGHEHEHEGHSHEGHEHEHEGHSHEGHSHGLPEHIKDAKITVHVEPSWNDVPVDSRIAEIAKNVKGVMGASHISTHKIDGNLYADLHAKVNRNIPLTSTYEIARNIEERIKAEIPSIERTVIRLEPYNEQLREQKHFKDKNAEQIIREILDKDQDILGTVKISSLKFGNLFKIDIDCLLDGELTVEEVHNVLIGIESNIRKVINNAVITIHPIPS